MQHARDRCHLTLSEPCQLALKSTGGDRSFEKALQDVISAYTHLKKAPAFA